MLGVQIIVRLSTFRKYCYEKNVMGPWKRLFEDVGHQSNSDLDNDSAQKQAFKLCKMCIFCASQQTKITKRLWKSNSALVNRFQLKSKCIISFFPYLEWISWACYSVHCEILPVRLTSAAESTKHGFSWWFSIDSPMIVEFKYVYRIASTVLMTMCINIYLFIFLFVLL